MVALQDDVICIFDVFDRLRVVFLAIVLQSIGYKYSNLISVLEILQNISVLPFLLDKIVQWNHRVCLYRNQLNHVEGLMTFEMLPALVGRNRSYHTCFCNEELGALFRQIHFDGQPAKLHDFTAIFFTRCTTCVFSSCQLHRGGKTSVVSDENATASDASCGESLLAIGITAVCMA